MGLSRSETKDIQRAKAEELQKALEAKGYYTNGISTSVTDFGVSTYLTLYDPLNIYRKFRISDHSVINTNRVFDEIHYTEKTPIENVVHEFESRLKRSEETSKIRQDKFEAMRQYDLLMNQKWEQIKDNFKGLVFKTNDRTYQTLEEFSSNTKRSNILQTQKGMGYGKPAYAYEWTEKIEDAGGYGSVRPSNNYIENYEMSEIKNQKPTSLDRFVLTKNINEYLTPEYIADIMVDLAIKHGYKGGDVLEPSMGHGVFFKSLLKHNFKQNLYGVEINEKNIEIVKDQFPQVNTYLSYLEWTVVDPKILSKIDQSPLILPHMDLVIGNPPYGKFLNAYKDLVDLKLPKDATVRYEGLFIYLSSLLLKPNGLLVFIITSLWLNNDNMYDTQKEMIENAGLTLIDAYRLPSNVFKESDTRKISGDLATDIVIFRKN